MRTMHHHATKVSIFPQTAKRTGQKSGQTLTIRRKIRRECQEMRIFVPE